jgi:hypothetical protein
MEQTGEIEAIGGIDDSAFTPNGDKKIFGKSGAPLFKMISEDKIYISDPNTQGRIHFEARMLPDNLIRFSVRNRDVGKDENNKHPDIRPFELMDRSIKYFEAKGCKIDGISSYWVSEGTLTDNYHDYWNYLNGFDEITKDDEVIAAKNTKIGKIYEKLGFPNPDPESISYPQNDGVPTVTCVFKKTPPV